MKLNTSLFSLFQQNAEPAMMEKFHALPEDQKLFLFNSNLLFTDNKFFGQNIIGTSGLNLYSAKSLLLAFIKFLKVNNPASNFKKGIVLVNNANFATANFIDEACKLFTSHDICVFLLPDKQPGHSGLAAYLVKQFHNMASIVFTINPLEPEEIIFEFYDNLGENYSEKKMKEIANLIEWNEEIFTKNYKFYETLALYIPTKYSENYLAKIKEEQIFGNVARGQKILIYSQEEASSDLLKKLLLESGYQVDYFKNQLNSNEFYKIEYNNFENYLLKMNKINFASSFNLILSLDENMQQFNCYFRDIDNQWKHLKNYFLFSMLINFEFKTTFLLNEGKKLLFLKIYQSLLAPELFLNQNLNFEKEKKFLDQKLMLKKIKEENLSHLFANNDRQEMILLGAPNNFNCAFYSIIKFLDMWVYYYSHLINLSEIVLKMLPANMHYRYESFEIKIFNKANLAKTLNTIQTKVFANIGNIPIFESKLISFNKETIGLLLILTSDNKNWCAIKLDTKVNLITFAISIFDENQQIIKEKMNFISEALYKFLTS